MPLSPARKAAYAALSVLVLLLGLEAAGRTIAAVPFSDAGDMIPHPRRGWTLPPNATNRTAGTNFSTNHLGMRGVEPSAVPGVYRILVLGDSNVFGVQVDHYQTFAARLLAVLGGTYAVDVQNAGVPGYACPQALDRYREVREDYPPDLVVAYVMHNDARLVQDRDRPWRSGAIARFQASGIVRLLGMGQQWLQARRKEVRTSLPDYRTCIRTLVEEQKARSARTLLVVPTTQVDFYGAQLATEGHLEGYRTVIRELAAETGTPLVDLAVQDWTRGQSARAVLLDEVHPTGLGHDLIARRLATEIATFGLPAAAPPAAPAAASVPAAP